MVGKELEEAQDVCVNTKDARSPDRTPVYLCVSNHLAHVYTQYNSDLYREASLKYEYGSKSRFPGTSGRDGGNVSGPVGCCSAEP